MTEDEDGVKIEEQNWDEDEPLEALRDIYDIDKKEPTFLYGLTRESFKHRLILKAEPQIGKTGAFLHATFLFLNKFKPFTIKMGQTRPNLKEICEEFPEYNEASTMQQEILAAVYTEIKTFYKLQTPHETKAQFKTQEGREMYKKHMRNINALKAMRKSQNILEPCKWAAICCYNCLQKTKNEDLEISIADFGCGEKMEFAQYFVEEYKRRAELQTLSITIYCLDLAQDLDLPCELKNIPGNMKVVLKTGVNCGSLKDIQEVCDANFDFVISTCALYGMKDTWKDTIVTAFETLKPGGCLLLAEINHKLSVHYARLYLSGVNIVEVDDDMAETEGYAKFTKKFESLHLLRTAKFRSAELRECLKDRKTKKLW